MNSTCLNQFDIVRTQNSDSQKINFQILKSRLSWKMFFITFHQSFMPPPLGAGGIMFSGCPAFRPAVCPSLRPERFPGICRRRHGGNGLKFCMLMYLGPPQNWLGYSHALLIFLLLAPFELVKRVKFGVSGHFWENIWRELPEILHADVFWPLSELFSLWSWSHDFSNFGTILT